MKIKLSFLLALLVTVLTNCNHDENDTEYDFSVLGIEQITIDDDVINTESNGFPLKDGGVFMISGCSNVNATRKYDLVIWKNYTEQKSVIVKRKYQDVSVSIKDDTESDCYIVTVSKEGYSEKVIYRIFFLTN